MRVFDEIALLNKMAQEKAEAKQKGKVLGFSAPVISSVDNVSTQEILNNSVKVIASTSAAAEVEEPVSSSSTEFSLEQKQYLDSLIQSVLNQVQTAKEEAEVANKEKEAAKKQVLQLTQQHVDANKELQNKNKQIEELTAERDNYIALCDRYKADSEKLTEMGKLQGAVSFDEPQAMTVEGVGSKEMRAYEKYIEKAPSQLVVTNSKAGTVRHRDLRAANAYWREHRTKIAQGVQQVLRDAGFLQGTISTNAATLPSDIPAIAISYLSTYIRENTQPDYIHWQFANEDVAPGTPPRLNTAVSRYPNIARPSTIASRQLTPGVAITSDSNPISELEALITIEELGLGRDVNNKPIGLTTFVKAYSIHDLENVVMNHLGLDYQAYDDLRLWTLWFATNVVVYAASDGTLLTSPTQLLPTDGQLTREFFVNLRSYMKRLQIKPYVGGLYAFIHNPSSWAQYVNQLQQQERFVTPEQKDLVTRMIQQSTGEVGGEISGLKGIHDGFVHFEQNVYGVGNNPGVDPGVTSISVADTPTTFDSCFAIGANTIAKATALPVEIRTDEVRDFGRTDRYIWYSHEGYGPLDVKADAPTGQELRVIQVRTRR